MEWPMNPLPEDVRKALAAQLEREVERKPLLLDLDGNGKCVATPLLRAIAKQPGSPITFHEDTDD